MILAYDLETLRLAVDWSAADKRGMGVACCGFRSDTGETWLAVAGGDDVFAAVAGIADHTVGIAQSQELFDFADVLVSFNGGDATEPGFDNVVLAGAGITVDPAKCVDMHLELKRANGGSLPKGCSLDALATANLGYGKTGEAASAPADWAAGKYRKVAKYCLHGDVGLTIGLYRLWVNQGYLLLPDGQRVEQGSDSLPRETNEAEADVLGGRAGRVAGVGNRGNGDREDVAVRGQLDHEGEQKAAQPVAQKRRKVQPVARPKLKLVQPVAQAKKQPSGATGGTQNKPNEADELQPPPIAGCEWRFTGYGWELWKRVPSVSEHGKRSSKRTYLAYYSREDVRREHDKRQKTTNARTA